VEKTFFRAGKGGGGGRGEGEGEDEEANRLSGAADWISEVLTRHN